MMNRLLCNGEAFSILNKIGGIIMVMSAHKIRENVNGLTEKEAKSLLKQVIQLNNSIAIQSNKSNDCQAIYFYTRLLLEGYGFYGSVSE